MAFKSYPGQCSCGNICNRLEKSGACPCLIQIHQNIFRYSTDGAASSRVGHILLFRVEGSIPYSARLSRKSVMMLACVKNPKAKRMIATSEIILCRFVIQNVIKEIFFY